MELGDALVNEGLYLGRLAGDKKVDLAHTGHQIGGVARSLIERFTMDRMAGGGNGRIGLGGRRGRLDWLIAASEPKAKNIQARGNSPSRPTNARIARLRSTACDQV